MRLQFSTWPEIENYLATSDAVVVPLGSTEQHGPNGLFGTDALCAEHVAWGGAEQAGETGAKILIAPTQALTPAQFNLDFPGTISLSASTFALVLEDVVRSLARSGFRRFYFLNGHGANVAVTRAAIHDLHLRRSRDTNSREHGLQFRFRSWWDYPQTNQLRMEFYGDAEGMHATPSEVAITQAVVDRSAPAAEDMNFAPLPAEFFINHAGDNHDDAHTHRAIFADGRVGSDPSLADPSHGRRLLNMAAKEFAEDFFAFTTEQIS